MECWCDESRGLLSVVDNSGETISVWNIGIFSGGRNAVHLRISLLDLETRQKIQSVNKLQTKSISTLGDQFSHAHRFYSRCANGFRTLTPHFRSGTLKS